MKKYKQTIAINAPAEKVVQIIATAEHLEDEAQIEGAISASARVEKEDGDNIVLVIDRVDPARGPAPNKTEKIQVTVKWDVKAMKCKWRVRVLGNEKLAKIQGSTEVIPDGEQRCSMCERASVEIKLPLVGNLIAGAILSGMKKDFAPKCKLIQKKADATA